MTLKDMFMYYGIGIYAYFMVCAVFSLLSDRYVIQKRDRNAP